MSRLITDNFYGDKEPVPGFRGKLDAKEAYEIAGETGSLHGYDLSELDLSEYELSGVDLARTNLSGADLTDANLNFTNLRHACLAGAKLVTTSMQRAIIANTDFTNATLIMTDLQNALFWEPDFTDAELIDVDFSDAIGQVKNRKIGEYLSLTLYPTRYEWRVVVAGWNFQLDDRDLLEDMFSSKALGFLDEFQAYVEDYPNVIRRIRRRSRHEDV